MIFTTAPDARAEDFTSDKTNIPYILSSAFKIKPAAGAPFPPAPREPGPVSPDFYFLSCNLKFNGSAGDN